MTVNGTTPAARMTKRLPLLVFAAFPAAGHVGPPLYIAQVMMSKGYEVIFMASAEFKSTIEKTGAEWYECAAYGDEEFTKMRNAVPPGIERTLIDMEHAFISLMPSRHTSLKSLLEMVQEREPGREVILLPETASMATIPFFCGASLPKGYTRMPKTIGLSVVPIFVTSRDTAPFGPGLPPDATESGRVRNQMLHEMIRLGPLRRLNDSFLNHLRALGCSAIPDDTFFFDSWYTGFDTVFQLCSPSMDYPRSDLPLNIRYAGTLPPRAMDPDYVFPSWWSELQGEAAVASDAPGKKKIIVVAQGTVNTDHSELVIPTIQALANRADTILVAILGVKGASLPADTKIPPNVRVVDYLPYDPLLTIADLFVMNGAYGAYVHAALNGVPVIAAGLSEDKLETSARIEYNGMGLNLRTQNPESGVIAQAAERILADPGFKHRAMRIRLDNRDMDALGIVQRELVAYS